MVQRNISLLGSTGSIGKNALAVIEDKPDRFNVSALAAGGNIDVLANQVRKFDPRVICVKEKEAAGRLAEMFPGKEVFHGTAGLSRAVAYPGVDTVISAITGTTALQATLDAIRLGHRVCLANKETLVAAGELINRELERSRAELLPIDSEQSAIFQSLGANHKDYVRRVILTASGGPFFNTPREAFPAITLQDALNHPTWSMGTKITIDSATLMNKALEVIEAFFLFRLEKDQVDVVIHPQSIVHSMVEYIDSSVIAQLSLPDMKIPILYSLSYPEREPFQAGKLNFSLLHKLEFYSVDREKFPAMDMARYVLEQGRNSGAVLNAANEVAVEYFLQEKLTFQQISTVVGEILYREKFYPLSSISDVNETIKETKVKTEKYIKQGVSK